MRITRKVGQTLVEKYKKSAIFSKGLINQTKQIFLCVLFVLKTRRPKVVLKHATYRARNRKLLIGENLDFSACAHHKEMSQSLKETSYLCL